MAVKGKMWQKCAEEGCRKHARLGNRCIPHGRIKELLDAPISVSAKPSVLDALLAAVSAKYADDGDRTKAGVVLSLLRHDPPLYYASVAHYPYGPMGKKVVVCQSKSEDNTTSDDAIEEVARKWYELNRPQPVESTLDALGEVLR